VKASLKKKFGRERGFTLTELAVAMLVVGILSAIAVPSFLGTRNSAFDKEAQAAVDAAMTAARTHYAQYGDFSSSDSTQCVTNFSTLKQDLQRIEPSLDFIGPNVSSTGPRSVSVVAFETFNSGGEELGCQAFWAAALSRSGTCWIGRITVEGKWAHESGLEAGFSPIVVQGNMNTENEEQVSMSDVPVNGNAYAAFKPQSSAADQTYDEIESLYYARRVCYAHNAVVDGTFIDGYLAGQFSYRKYFDSWRNVVRTPPNGERTATTTTVEATTTTVYTEP
jgi:prepilin-type N-terminal cleavage/methylation domain-containing protein